MQRAAGDANIYVISARGGRARRLTFDAAEDTVPSWSHDGKEIYYASDRSGSQQVWKIPAAGGEPVQVTRQGGFAPIESADGRFLYFTRSQRGSDALWRRRLADGEESQILEALQGPTTFAVAENGIYFFPPQVPGAAAVLQFLNLATGAARTLTTIQKPVVGSLAVSPDGRSVLYAQADNLDSDIMLVENFR